jgi:hypothetical protein
LGCGVVKGKAPGWAASVVAGSVADVCWRPLSAAGFIGQLLELTGVVVFTAGGTAFFELSTPPVGINEPALPAAPAGSGAVGLVV